jgi:hypothetical protein
LRSADDCFGQQLWLVVGVACRRPDWRRSRVISKVAISSSNTALAAMASGDALSWLSKAVMVSMGSRLNPG